jgi:hypothetical protein
MIASLASAQEIQLRRPLPHSEAATHGFLPNQRVFGGSALFAFLLHANPGDIQGFEDAIK